MLNSFMSLDIIDIPLYLFSNDLDLSVCSEVIHLSEVFRTFSYVIENIWVCLKVILRFSVQYPGQDEDSPFVRNDV